MKKVEFTEMRSVDAGYSFISRVASWGFDTLGFGSGNTTAESFFVVLRSLFLKGFLGVFNNPEDISDFGDQPHYVDNYSVSFFSNDGRSFTLAISKILAALSAFGIRL